MFFDLMKFEKFRNLNSGGKKMNSFSELWDTVAEQMKENKYITDIGYNLWLGESYIIDFSDNKFYISVPTEFHRDIIDKTYTEKLKSCFFNIIGAPIEIEYVVNIDESRGIVFDNNTSDKKSEVPKETDIGSDFTFDNFVLGPSNRYAHAAAMAVAENPTVNYYNPLLIYGASGVGKTHLMFAIKNHIARLYPTLKIEYIRCEDFTNMFIESTRAGTANLFHNRFRSVDVLLIDDIQFIEGKIQTQEEFFNTFNSLQQAKKQIVITSDRPPKEINNLDDRLRSRFEGGMLADIASPDLETRVGIITMKTKALGITLGEDLIFYIADQVKTNNRQLEGIINQIKAYINLHKITPSISVIQGYIRNITSESAPDPVNTDRVITEVARQFNISEDDIRSKKKNAEIVWARHAAIYITSKVTNISNMQISKEFKRDHASIGHALKKVEQIMESDPYKKRNIEEIIENLKRL